MFSCEYWDILKKTYFEEHLQTTASASNFKMFHFCFDFMANICRMYDRYNIDNNTIC